MTQSAQRYEAGHFDEAIQLLEEAYAIEPNATILYNLARAYEGKGDLDKAIDAYGKYLQGARDAEDRGAVEQRIATLRRQVEEKAALERERDAAAQRAAEARREAQRAKRDEKASKREPKHEPSVVPWIVAGVGAVVIGGGVFFGWKARSRHEEATDAKLARDSADLNDQAKTFALLANISFAAGGVVLVGGTTWAMLDRSGGPEARGIIVTGTF